MPLPPRPHSFLLLWTQTLCRRLRNAGDTGKPMEVAYGGSHSSEPLISRYGVQPGDTLYTVSLRGGVLNIEGAMTVAEIVPWNEYADRWTPEEIGLTQRRPPGCCVEAVVGTDGAPLLLDRPIPEQVINDLYFIPKNGKERRFRQVRDGKVTGTAGIHGHVHRLRPDAADAFRSLAWPRREADESDR